MSDASMAEASRFWGDRLEMLEAEVRVLRELLARADATIEAQRLAITALGGLVSKGAKGES